MKNGITVILSVILLVCSINYVLADPEQTRVGEDLFMAGDDIVIDETIYGDLYVVGGNIKIRSSVHGDIIAFGGSISIEGDVLGKIFFSGGMADISGDAQKAVIVAGDVDILKGCNIGTNAVIFAGNVNFRGNVEGELRVISNNFVDNGTYGDLVLDKSPFNGNFRDALSRGINFLSFILFIIEILVAIGFLLLGMFIFKYFRSLFLDIEQEIVRSPVITTILGFILILASAFSVALMFVTMVGLPFAVAVGLLSILGLMLSVIFVSLPFGRLLARLTKREASDYWLIALGFISLRILFWIPYIGIVFLLITLSLGYGAIFYVVKEKWPKNRAS